MLSSEALGLARHYQELTRQRPDESHFWTARSLYYGRTATRTSMSRTGRSPRDSRSRLG